jgi:NAD(P)H dehydrogenase (quinone)
VLSSIQEASVKLLLTLVAATAALAQQPPIRILVAYHSETGNTEKLAQAVGKGAGSVEGVEVAMRRTADVKDEDIPRFDGFIVGTPVQWANASTETKRFLDRIGAALWKAKMTGDGRTAGAFCTGGGVAMGKDVARLSIISAFLTMRFTIIGGVDADGFGTLGPEATTGSADPGISEKEQDEARRFGERFARMTRQIRRKE